MHGSGLSELQTRIKWLGNLFTVVAMLMTGYVGWKLGGDGGFGSILLATGLAGISFMVAILFNFVEAAWISGHTRFAKGLAIFLAIGAGTELYAHIAFGVGHRSGDIQQAKMQDVRYVDTRSGVADLERTLKSLEAKHDWQKSYDPPAAYEARIETAAKSVEVEASRGGCKSRCLALKSQHASLVAEQAIAADRLAVTEEIKTVRKQLADARKASGSTKKGDSIAFDQQLMTAQLMTWSLHPSEAAITWAGILVSFLIGVVITFAPAVCNFLGYRDWKADAPSRPASTSLTPVGMTTVPAGSNTYVIKDTVLRDWAEKNAHLLPQLKAA